MWLISWKTLIFLYVELYVSTATEQDSSVAAEALAQLQGRLQALELERSVEIERVERLVQERDQIVAEKDEAIARAVEEAIQRERLAAQEALRASQEAAQEAIQRERLASQEALRGAQEAAAQEAMRKERLTTM